MLPHTHARARRALGSRLALLAFVITAGALISCARPRAGDDASTRTTSVLLENEWLRVLDSRLPKHAKQAIVRCVVPTVQWQVLSALEPTPRPTFCTPGETLSFAHGGRGNADQERRDIIFEILQEPKLTEAEVRARLAAPMYSTDIGSTLLFENRYCRLWDFMSAKGGMDGKHFHQHALDYAFVTLREGHLNLFAPSDWRDPESAPKFVFPLPPYTDGQVTWLRSTHGGFREDGVTPLVPILLHGVENLPELYQGNSTEWREYAIELK